jgi:putative DNA methylase
MQDDKRLIEDYLPIEAISAEASREKSVRKGHISTLHLWWARRPLVACRAAVYGALVPASRFRPANGPEEKRASLARANAAKFVKSLCTYPGAPHVIAEAGKHILEAHAERLTEETGKRVTVEDIVEGRAPRPKVLDMFAGGGAIPLEALRLGCDAYAMDLNPVAYIIELCTLVYPQKYGKPDPNAKGSAADGTWAGLAEEVRHWGEWVLKKVKAEIGDLYPLIPDPDFKGKRPAVNAQLWKDEAAAQVPPGCLMPVAYLWTRTVTCKNPACKATVPLVRQTWLCKKDGRYVALKTVPVRPACQAGSVKQKHVRFEVVEAPTEKALGFDPEAGSKGGNATCRICGTVADIEYVKDEGWEGRMGQQLMSIACTRPGAKGKVYLSVDDLREAAPDDEAVRRRIEALSERTGLTVPRASIANLPPNCRDNSLGIRVRPYGLRNWGDLFTPRQMLCLLTFAAAVREAEGGMRGIGYEGEQTKGVATYLALVLDRLADWNSSLCSWAPEKTGGAKIGHTFGRQALPMVWDFTESGVWGDATGSVELCLEWVLKGLEESLVADNAPVVSRGTATALPWPDASFDAVVTDPPYYDNVPYADISDFFYVWLKRTVGHLYPEHFAGEGTPKKPEAVADATRHGGDNEKARRAYEQMMAQSFRQAHRVLKPGGQTVVVYAHKTTLGWATLVDALRGAGFTVTEAWPLDTEMKSRLRGMDSAALASSIFLVARKREGNERGECESEVRPDLERIVRERVGTLWGLGVSGADLVIACVGAGLRAFTRYAKVEYANGEEVPAARFLAEVETVVLEGILARLSKEVGGNGGRHSLAGVDPATRFYILWRYTYRLAELDAGEAIIFANGTHVELDGPHALCSGARPLIEKKKGKYRLLDYQDRGEDAELGMPREDGQPAPLVDALHRTLWLMEKRPAGLADFLRKAQPNLEQMRLVAQALAGPALKGGELANVSPGGELAALAKLTANWRSVVEDAAGGPLFRAARRTE